VTYLIVRYGLMELTNFRISNLSYLYEDLATSILASPKAYIILITTAFLASRMNLKYGLDYSGILIPALIALQWYQPSKILTTAVEAGLIYLIGVAVLKLPIFANVTIEGARKLILFFNIGFFYKLILGHILVWLTPDLKITDFFGFGYLLATLLAIKMHDKNILLRVSRATIQTSLAGTLVASVIGFSLGFLPSFGAWWPSSESAVSIPVVQSRQPRLAELYDQDRIALYAGQFQPAVRQLTGQIEIFGDAVKLLIGSIDQPDQAAVSQARAMLRHIGFELHEADGRYFYLRDVGSASPRGIFIIDRIEPGRLLVELPVPFESPHLAAAGLTAMKGLHARALAVAPAEWTSDGAVSNDALTNYQSMFQEFHRAVAGHDVLQLRALGGGDRLQSTNGAPGGDRGSGLSIVRVKERLPPGLDLAALEALVGPLRVEFGAGRSRNIQREEVDWGFAEVLLGVKAARDLVSHGEAPVDSETIGNPQMLRTAGVADRILAAASSIAQKGTDLYRPPTLEELLFFDTEVLSPVLRAVATEHVDGRWSQDGLARLRAAAISAHAMGYRLERIADPALPGEFLIFEEVSQGARRGYRGTFVVRVDAPLDYIVQVPRPLQDVGVIEFGTGLFTDLNAGAILIAGAHPNANLDGSANLTDPDSRQSLFNLFNQILLRETGRRPTLLVQCRAMRDSAGDVQEFDAIVSFDDGAVEEAQLSPLGAGLLRHLTDSGLRLHFADGSPEVAGHDTGDVSQANYLAQTQGKELMAIWLSSHLRLSVAQLDKLERDRPQFDALFIPTEQQSVAQFLRERGVVAGGLPAPAIRDAVRGYRESRDIVQLQILDDLSSGYRLARLVDRSARRSFLAFLEPDGVRVAALASLAPQTRMAERGLPAAFDDSALSQAIADDPAWLSFEAEQ
jgi:hypothetical protein